MSFIESQVDRFFYWMNERHSIYRRRAAGNPFPWTDDRILQRWKFTNVFRELDAVTVALHRRLDVKPLSADPVADRWYRLVLFRLFNWPDTYDAIHKAGVETKFAKMRTLLLERQRRGHKIFTGAYIIPSLGRASKVETAVESLAFIHSDRDFICRTALSANTLRNAVDVMARMPMHGRFMAYELACDMRYQERMLDNATDVLEWANPGPGAKRGINRLYTGSPTVGRLSINAYVEAMRELLHDHAPRHWAHNRRLEMREIEHSLCEFDKYERARRKEGRPRSKYTPPKATLL